MYSPSFDYVRAGSVSEAVSLLAEHSGAKLLAGGHSLIPLLKLRQITPSLLVDIGGIDELAGIAVADSLVRVGALTTHATIAASGEVPTGLAEAAGLVADLQVRNRGTIGGNVAHADPASDLPTKLTALNATFHLVGPEGDRSLAATDFFTGMFDTALSEGEVLSAVEFPVEGAGTGSAYAKMSNPASGYAMLGAAAVVTVADGKCTAAGVAVGGLTPLAIRLPSVEANLVGKTLDAATLASAAASVADDLGDDLLGDIHTSAEYRRAMAPVYVRRALTSAAQRASE